MALMSIIEEHVEPTIPEHFLWIAVIGQAIFDAYLCTNKEEAHWVRDALRFFDSDDLAVICDLLRVDRDWLLGLIRVFARHSRHGKDNQRERVARRLTGRAECRQRRFIAVGQMELFA